MRQREWTWKLDPILSLVAGILVFYACQDNSSSVPPSSPQITSISPKSGAIGISAAIHGSGIEPDAQDNKVIFGGILSDVSSSAAEKIEASSISNISSSYCKCYSFIVQSAD